MERALELKHYPTKDGKRLHRLRAEQALGKPLPAKAVVHHVDGTKRGDAPLVICQDETYHCLLHMRTRILQAGGDPNTQRMCARCRQPKDISAFHAAPYIGRTVQGYCKECQRLALLEWTRARRAQINQKRRVEYHQRGPLYQYIVSPEVRARQNELRRIRRAAGKRN